jgi:hypothetical protein
MHRRIRHLTSPDLLHGAPFDQRLLPPREAAFADQPPDIAWGFD